MVYAVKLDKRVNISDKQTRRSMLVVSMPVEHTLKSWIERHDGDWHMVTQDFPELKALLNEMEKDHKLQRMWEFQPVRTFVDRKWDTESDRTLTDRIEKYKPKNTGY